MANGVKGGEVRGEDGRLQEGFPRKESARRQAKWRSAMLEKEGLTQNQGIRVRREDARQRRDFLRPFEGRPGC